MKYTNNNFRGQINGIDYRDIYAMLSELRRSNAQENIDNINKILDETDEFWTKVFMQQDEEEFVGGIKLCDLKKDESLYSESNIALLLERMADFILSGAKKKDNPETYIRTFNTQKMNAKAIDESNWVDFVGQELFRGHNGDDLDLVSKANMNYKLKREFDMSDKDIAEIDRLYGDKYPVIRGYYECYENAREEYTKLNNLAKERKLTKEEKLARKTWEKCVTTYKQDVMDSYRHFVAPIKFKQPLKDAGCPCWDEYNEMDKDHIRYALQIEKEYLDIYQDGDLYCIVLDLENTIKQCEFTDIQAKVLRLWRYKCTLQEIADELGVTHQAVNLYVNAICKIIADKNFDIFEDWYYLDVARGEYKTCNCCGQVKLISKFPKNGKYTRNTCKECMKKNK